MPDNKILIEQAKNPVGLVSVLKGRGLIGHGDVSQYAAQIAPVATLAHIICRLDISQHQRIAVLGMHMSNRAWGSEFYALLGDLLGETSAIDVDVYRSDFSLSTECELNVNDSMVNVTVCDPAAFQNVDYDLIFWPSPSLSFSVDSPLLTTFVAKQIQNGARVFACHFSRFDSLLESLYTQEKSLHFLPLQKSLAKNTFAVTHGTTTWGNVLTELSVSNQSQDLFPGEPVEVFGIIAQMCQEHAQVDNVFDDFERIALGTVDKSVKIHCLSKSLGINCDHLGVYRRHSGTKTERIGFLSSRLANIWKDSESWSEDRLRAALSVAASIGIPHFNSKDEQDVLEKRLAGLANDGSGLAALILGGYLEKKGKISDAVDVYGLATGDPYCLYQWASLDTPDNTPHAVTKALLMSLSLGLGCAAPAIMQVLSTDPNVIIEVKAVGWDINDIVAEGLHLSDPDILTVLSRTEMDNSRYETAIKYLTRALEQGSREAFFVAQAIPAQVVKQNKHFAKLLKRLTKMHTKK